MVGLRIIYLVTCTLGPSQKSIFSPHLPGHLLHVAANVRHASQLEMTEPLIHVPFHTMASCSFLCKRALRVQRDAAAHMKLQTEITPAVGIRGRGSTSGTKHDLPHRPRSFCPIESGKRYMIGKHLPTNQSKLFSSMGFEYGNAFPTTLAVYTLTSLT